MVDQGLMNLVRNNTPIMNPDICNGIAVKYVPYADTYIDSVFKSVSKNFPPGLEYVGFQQCSPYEELREEPKKKNDIRLVDIARSDIYLVKYLFRFNGNDLPPKYIFLPFVSDAGSIILSGSRYFISPVLSDIIMSIEHDNVFVRLLRDKFSIRRVPHAILVDNRRKITQVPWSSIYHVSKEQAGRMRSTRAKCSLMHYLLCRYGFTETFKMFTGCEPIVGINEITSAKYPEKDWVICESTKLKPTTFMNRQIYQPNLMRVAVPRAQYNSTIETMIGSFFYIVDHFPSRIIPPYVNNLDIWKILMGRIYFGDAQGEGELRDVIDDHIRSLDEYMDTIVVSKFKEIGYNCEDIYKFFAIAIANFNDWLISSNEKANSLYNKELSILYDVLISITTSIFNFHFRLKTLVKKGLTERELITHFNMIKSRRIFMLTRSPAGVSNMSYSGDNKVLKITTTMVPQKNNNASGSAEDFLLTDPSKLLHTSFATVGNYSNLPKSNPIGDGRVNPYQKLSDGGRVSSDVEHKEMLDKIEAMIKHF